MGIVSGIALYIIIWWTLIFMILPFGLRREANPETGHDRAAPQAHTVQIKRKFVINTVLSAVLWLIIYLIVKSDMWSFREMAERLIQVGPDAL